MLSAALMTLIDVPRTSPYEWYNLRRTIRLQIGSAERSPQTAWGFTTAIAETGVEVSLTQSLADLDERLPVQIELVEEGLVL